MLSRINLKIVKNLRVKSVPALDLLNFRLRKAHHTCPSTESLYNSDYAKSISDPEGYWKTKVDLLEWYEKPKTILDRRNTPFDRW